MADPTVPTTVNLIWEGDLLFQGSIGPHTIAIDGREHEGPTPMQLVAFGLAGCMAIDVVNIVTRGRHPLSGLKVRLDGYKAQGPPARWVKMTLHVAVEGKVTREVIERAIQLSHEKYCSVWHSLRQDIEFDISFDVVD